MNSPRTMLSLWIWRLRFLFNLSHADGELVAGNVTLSHAVISQERLSGCDLLIDGGFYETTQADLTPAYSIETELLSDGAHSFTMECTDATGEKADETLNLIVRECRHGDKQHSTRRWPDDWREFHVLRRRY